MISYQVYKVMHLAAIFVFLSGAAILLVSDSKSKFWKIVTGVSSFFILLGGMGLVARLYPAASGGGGFAQAWVQAKIILWFVLAGLGHFVAKRFPGFGVKAYWITILLAVTAATLAIYKPA